MARLRPIAYLNIFMPFWFLFLYLMMSDARQDYSHLTEAISELGSLDAPNLWIWNIFGYVLPGFTVSLLGLALYRIFPSHPKRSAIAAIGLLVFGLLMALSGVFPADMSDLSAPTSRLHIAGAMGSYPAFLVSGFLYPKLFAAHSEWRWASKPSLILVVLSVASGPLRFLGDAPGLGQRITFATVFAWLILVSVALLLAVHRSERQPNA
ncbi:MAG: DUF998 domain-containing protein [Pseudoxanthomonas suwonensis]|nr:DUF998 domain-containing protein [Pseudoxanthomonas suwonensis]